MIKQLTGQWLSWRSMWEIFNTAEFMHFFGISKSFTYNSFWNLTFAQTHQITEFTNLKQTNKQNIRFIKSHIADPTNQKVIICLSSITDMAKKYNILKQTNKKSICIFFIFEILLQINVFCLCGSQALSVPPIKLKTHIPKWGQENVFPSLPLYSSSFQQAYKTVKHFNSRTRDARTRSINTLEKYSQKKIYIGAVGQ